MAIPNFPFSITRKLLSLSLLLFALITIGGCEEEEDEISFDRSGEVAHSNYSLIEETYPEFFDGSVYAVRGGIDADGTRACAYRMTAATGLQFPYLDCWGTKTASGSLVRDKEPQAKSLSIGRGHVCVRKTSHNGTGIYCEGSNGDGQSLNPAIAEGASGGHYTWQPKMLSSGDNHNCVIDQLGVYCWGNNSFGQLDAPEIIEPIFVVSAENHNCVIDSAKSVHCWGDNASGQTQVPDALVNVNYLALGKDFSCALSGATVEENVVTCWGNTQWQVPVPDSMGWDFINAGDDHVCAVDNDATEDEVACWGNNGSGQLTVPSLAQNNVYNLVSGTGFSCALVEYLGYPVGVTDRNIDEITEGTFEVPHLGAVCWGENSEGQLNSPKFLCHGFHTSALLTEERFCPDL